MNFFCERLVAKGKEHRAKGIRENPSNPCSIRMGRRLNGLIMIRTDNQFKS
jgi:hypothetical protein